MGAIPSNITALLKSVMAGLGDRQKLILEGRYGLVQPRPLTLAELGSHYGLTRERIRQIEALVLKQVQKNVKRGDSTLGAFVKEVLQRLHRTGNVKREDTLLRELAATLVSETEKTDQVAHNRLRFMLEICNKFVYANDSNHFYPYWYLHEGDKKHAVSFVNKVLNAWGIKKEVKNSAEYASVFASVSKSLGLDEATALNYASLSKHIVMNCYGDLGPTNVGEINPRTAREWAYLVLKKERRPVHFTELADMISRLKAKPVHAPTVHNELIKDDVFVLVGKGTYTLREFGVIPGTAREVIMHYLRKHGPMKPREVIQFVSKDRIFKENTILINLQNKKHFKRLNDGRYTTLA